MEFHKKVSVLGVISGSIVAVIGSTIGVFVLGFLVGIFLASSGAEATTDSLPSNPWFVAATVLVMFLFSLFGGYIAAYTAKHDELLNAALSSILAMLLAICSLTTDPFYLAMLSLIANPLFAMLGGFLRLKQKGRNEQPLSVASMTDLRSQESQAGQNPILRSSTSHARTGKPSPLIQLGGIVIVVGIIWSLWFGWSLGSFAFPGFTVLVGYGIFRLIRKDG